MISTIRVIAKLCAAIVGVAVLFPTVPSHAENFAFVAPDGGGLMCTALAPCLTISTALTIISPPVRVICLNGAGTGVNNSAVNLNSGGVISVDCPLATVPQIKILGANTTMRIQHVIFRDGGFGSQIIFQGSGMLIFEDCTFEDSTVAALDIEPSGPLKLVMKNSRISNSGGGILLKPATGGSINATLDHVTITGNTGGGIKSDSTNGVVSLDVTDSEISNNGGNGINAAGGFFENLVSVKNSVVSRNGTAGIQANGVNSAVLVATTLLDQNAAGATSIAGSGNMLTYGNNQIVGSPGSGFNQQAGLQ